jgi:hypothetical protein
MHVTMIGPYRKRSSLVVLVKDQAKKFAIIKRAVRENVEIPITKFNLRRLE